MQFVHARNLDGPFRRHLQGSGRRAKLGLDGARIESRPIGLLLATTRVTSHVPLRAVADLITEDRVLDAIRLAHETLRAGGNPRPRIGVAGLNPHAGDGGIFGREEIEVIGPAVARARAQQIAADGPYPSDTVFLRARDRAFDAVVTTYHDQGQIAMKLMGFERGITIAAGLPVPVTTPAHGTAFDIAGRGIARVDAVREALPHRLPDGAAACLTGAPALRRQPTAAGPEGRPGRGAQGRGKGTTLVWVDVWDALMARPWWWPGERGGDDGRRVKPTAGGRSSPRLNPQIA
jgi:Pyridoxal phosphate biosynthetic protein PdxA